MRVPPLLGRAFTIGAVALLLLVPIAMISGKVSERRARAEAVVAQFAHETTGPQVVAGPLLAFTCEETFVEERNVMRAGKEETVAERRTRACPDGYFPPRTLSVSGTLPVETRRLGIYEARLYHASLEMKGELQWPAPPPSDGGVSRAWKHAYVVVQVSDPRGIKAAVSSFATPRERARTEPLARHFAIEDALGDYGANQEGEILPFSYQLRLDGTSSLHVAPVGDASVVRLHSNWPHPSFVGKGSPDTRDVRASGFDASWNATRLATGGRAAWETAARKDALKIPPAAAGVALVEPVNVYALSYRATEYAFLFILFTFAVLALMEALAGLRLHPVQYALVGSAIAVFFLLLLAISEHASFAFAYGTAAGACTLLITTYLRHPLRSRARSAACGALFGGVYALLYVLLTREDDALLVGSLMVFALLATAMMATRRIDWSDLGRRLSTGQGAA